LSPKVVIPFADVVRIEKKMTAFVIPNAICVSTVDAKVREKHVSEGEISSRCADTPVILLSRSN
jgi:hypothetical protein